MSDINRKAARGPDDALPRGRVEIAERRQTVLWQHGPATPVRGAANSPVRPQGPHSGRGPRGYVRSPARIYEDLCDRLTENPFVDASEVEVTVSGTEVTLTGTVADIIAMRQAQAIAEEVAGVTHVHNRMQIRDGAEPEMTPGKAVNEALGAGEEP